MHIRLKTLLHLGLAARAPGGRGIHPVGYARSSAGAVEPGADGRNGHGPHGFPAWLRITHFINLLFLILLIRSGLQILMDHPRLYGNVHCTPGTEWLRLTPIEVPKDRI